MTGAADAMDGVSAITTALESESDMHINELLNSEKMRTKQVKPELDAEQLGKKGALQQHEAEETKKRLSDGNKEQNAVPLPAAPPPNKKQRIASMPACNQRRVWR